MSATVRFCALMTCGTRAYRDVPELGMCRSHGWMYRSAGCVAAALGCTGAQDVSQLRGARRDRTPAVPSARQTDDRADPGGH